ncbi:replicative DNA helicase [Candidatus Amarobacter glycogenicus]|uniref:replicative DNA helicase n=1 Tax=Candidatus Amarobacter glycogenicus TaxID=3140699 RepID=UPI002A0ABE72|nr:replicative DNA helicase [Dehalococcoidia bacterium]MBK8560061.1 replicative DNA helicase [Dehalococcoidia bacterium]MBK9342198.1 replicative DNA helicase [Dehalococcoidia bacterium]MBK9611386.1 replicative DNA helicase [Dehalococcoidia bacterium]
MTLAPLERLPPHDIEAEEAVIASLMVDPQAMIAVQGILKAQDFFREKNGWVYDSCLALWNRDEVVNQITVAHELATRDRLEDVGGQVFLADIIRRLPTSLGAEFYARIVKRDSTYRGLIHAATGILQMAYEAPAEIEQVFSKAENLIQRIRGGESFRDFVHIRQLLDAYLDQDPDEIERIELSAIRTGFTDLDTLLTGLKRSDLVIIGARPSVGKSSFALGIARNAAIEQRAHVAFFSLEMSSEQLAIRLLSAESGVDSSRLRLGQNTELEERRVVAAAGRLSEANIWFDDSPMLTAAELRAKARRLAGEAKQLDLIVIDYLQLMQGESQTGRENRVQEISYISRTLKGLARELDVPIVALAQLSRAIENRHPRTPMLSDLRDSGSIEQDADIVMFLSREELYVTQEQWAQQHPDLPESAYPKGVAQVSVAKHRNGPTGSVELRFRDRFAKFEDWVLRTDDLPE